MRRTWSPRGKTPTITHRFGWKNLSAIAAPAADHAGEEGRLFLSPSPGSVNSDKVTGFIASLRRHIRGGAILLWDGLPSRRSRAAKFIAGQAHRLSVVRFPPYAPELNPVEYLWGNAKSSYLANFPADGLSCLEHEAKRYARHVRRCPNLPQALLRHAGLF